MFRQSDSKKQWSLEKWSKKVAKFKEKTKARRKQRRKTTTLQLNKAAKRWNIPNAITSNKINPPRRPSSMLHKCRSSRSCFQQIPLKTNIRHGCYRWMRSSSISKLLDSSPERTKSPFSRRSQTAPSNNQRKWQFNSVPYSFHKINGGVETHPFYYAGSAISYEQFYYGMVEWAVLS